MIFSSPQVIRLLLGIVIITSHTMPGFNPKAQLQGWGQQLKTALRWSKETASTVVHAPAHMYQDVGSALQAVQEESAQWRGESHGWRTQAAEYRQEIGNLRQDLNTHAARITAIADQRTGEVTALGAQLQHMIDQRVQQLDTRLAGFEQLGHTLQQSFEDSTRLTERLVNRMLGTTVGVTLVLIAWKEWRTYRRHKELEWQLKNLQRIERLAKVKEGVKVPTRQQPPHEGTSAA